MMEQRSEKREVKNDDTGKLVKELKKNYEMAVGKQVKEGCFLDSPPDTEAKNSLLWLRENNISSVATYPRRQKTMMENLCGPSPIPSFRVYVRYDEQWIGKHVLRKRLAESAQEEEPAWKILKFSTD